MTILFVGQAPSSSAGHRRAFDGASGKRLARLIGISLDEFLAKSATKNLLQRFPGKAGDGGRGGTGDAFPMREAKRRARKFDFGGASVVVFCGSRVAFAFGHETPHFSYEKVLQYPFVRTSIPHPSGVSRW